MAETGTDDTGGRFTPLTQFDHLPDTHMLTPAEVAAAYRVHAKTPATWNRYRGLPATTTPGGRRLYSLGDLRRWEAEQQRLADERGA